MLLVTPRAISFVAVALRLRLDLRYRWNRWCEKMVMGFVWALPRRVVMWAFMRVMAHATQGPWGNEHPDDVTWGMALKRWESA